MKGYCLICKKIVCNNNSKVIVGGVILKHVKTNHPSNYGIVGIILR